MAVRAKIADAWLNLDKLQEADAQYESIYQQAQQRVIDKNRNDASRLNLALISVKWGAVRQRLTADPAEGEKYRSEATALLRDIIQNPNPELLPGTNKPDPNSPAMHQVTDALQQSLLYSASVATKSGKLDEAFNLYKEIEQVNQTVVNEIDKAAQWYQAMPEDRKLAVANYFKQNVDLGKSGQANLLVRQGKTEQAVPIYELVIEKRLKNYEEQPNDFSVRDQLALQYRNYAQNMLRANRAEDAVRLMGKAHDLTEKNHQEDPTNARYKKSHGYSLYYWGVARDAVGQKPDALALFERSRALRQEMFDASPDHSNKVDLMLSEGRIGNTESCLKLVRELSAIEAKNSDLRLDLARALAQLARSTDEAAEKEALLNQAFVALSKAVGDGLTDPFAVTSEMDLVPLRADERFNQTLANIRK
jgi:tetratricopeptide (TPR) repeat protein